jgi:8-oxo-dGTP diphosphatase
MTPPSYCLGFAFGGPQFPPNTYRHGMQVALIRKIKPEWQAGRLNGIGGMIEDFDRDGCGASRAGLNAMVREFREETGVETECSDWKHFHTMGSEEWQVECFRAFDMPLHMVRTTTKEEVVLADVDRLPYRVLYNLRWLIPLALDPQPLPTMQVYR